jgi:chromosome segregation ATPase
VDKWAAAEVNLALHGENEALGNYREAMMELDEKATAALKEREEAKQALIQAEETLAAAKATIEEGNRFIDAATENVVETGLALFVARTAGGMLDDPSSSPMPVEVAGTLGPEELKGISGRLPEIEKALADTFSKVQATTAELQRASKTAAETPKVIEERTRMAREKEGTVAALMQEKDQTLRQLEEQQKKVEELKKKYESMYYKFADMPAEKKVVEMPK